MIYFTLSLLILWLIKNPQAASSLWAYLQKYIYSGLLINVPNADTAYDVRTDAGYRPVLAL